MQISAVCENAIHVMRYLCNRAAEGAVYETWGDVESQENVKSSFNVCKKNINWKEIFDLPDAERILLGFRYFDKPTTNDVHTLMLIPIWIVACLPNDFTLMTTDLNGNSLVIDFNKIDKDTRYGCIAYQY